MAKALLVMYWQMCYCKRRNNVCAKKQVVYWHKYLSSGWI